MVAPERRLAYARHILRRAGVEDPRLEQAFAKIEREAFAEGPPWRLVPLEGLGLGIRQTSHAEDLYSDSLIVLEADRGVNNGSPALHAQLIEAIALTPGSRVAHIGAGGGYYTAIVAELVGPDGQVIAVEIDRPLAEAAERNLKPWPQVEVRCADGAEEPRETVDVVYVSVAAAAPTAPWVQHLAPGGRLLFPLGAPGHAVAGYRSSREAAMLLVERQGREFAARFLMPVSFVFAEALLGSDADADALHLAMQRGGWEKVRSLRWGDPGPQERAWCWTPHWSLSYDPPAGQTGG